MTVRIGVITFPGSLDDRDAQRAIRVAGGEPVALWHGDHDLGGVDALVLPGGFSYGDYLRAGAIAAHAPIMREVADAAAKGMPILGICNGFQILLEAGMLPGAMRMNKDRRFICKDIFLRVERHDTAFSAAIPTEKTLKIPIAHHEGNWVASEETYRDVVERGQVLFRYASEEGNLTDSANPNGSMGHVAGLINERGNVLGMMPHPERASESVLGATDGAFIFESISRYFEQRATNAVS